MRKIFLICLALLLVVQAAASAKSLAAEERIKVAVEIEDGSRHQNLNTVQILERALDKELGKKNRLLLVGSNVTGGPFDENASVANLGELLVFDAVELTEDATPPENFDADFYAEVGANYVVRCEVLALGLTKVDDDTLGIVSDVVGTGLGFADKESVQYVGLGISMLGYIQMKRTALANVVKVQFLDATTKEVLWQEHFVGRAVKHHSGGKNYPDVWTRAFNESVEDTARRISKRVNQYVDKNIVKGKRN